jgi:shikimate kinase
MTEEVVLPPSARRQNSASVVVLVGFMGAGKTTVGQALARRLGWRFEDLDKIIEARESRSIAQIFDEDGEDRFRNLERVALQEKLAEDSGGLVLALGGGAFVDLGTRELLCQRNIPAVWLNASADELFRRCNEPGVVRPLRRNAEQFRQLYEKRISAYREADICIETEAKDVASLVEEIMQNASLALTSRSSE